MAEFFTNRDYPKNVIQKGLNAAAALTREEALKPKSKSTDKNQDILWKKSIKKSVVAAHTSVDTKYIKISEKYEQEVLKYWCI